jgi:hypothetical protein
LPTLSGVANRRAANESEAEVTGAGESICCTGITIVNRDRVELQEDTRVLIQREDVHEFCSTGTGRHEMLNVDAAEGEESPLGRS